MRKMLRQITNRQLLITSLAKGRGGQALLLILLAMSVALVLGVAISSRVITALHQTSLSAQSAQALTFAESGLEEALKCLKDKTCSAPYSPPAKDIDGDGVADFSYTVTTAGNSPVFSDLSPLQRDKAVQIALTGYPAATSIFVSWVSTSSASEKANPMALEVSLIYQESGTYKLTRFSYDPDGVRKSQNNFLAPGALGYNVGGTNYQYQISISAPATPVMLRLRPLYSAVNNSFAVSAAVGNNIPSQGAIIESTGYSRGVVRKVRSIFASPALSQNFDFVLFSGSQTSPLTR